MKTKKPVARKPKNGPKKAHGERVKAYRSLIGAEWKMTREVVKLAREVRSLRSDLKAVRGRLSRLEKERKPDYKALLKDALRSL